MIVLAAWFASGEGPFATVAAFAAVAGVLILIWSEFVKPKVRRWRLRKPCDVRFVIRRQGHAQLGYVIQDDKDHMVGELVVPAHRVVEIEVGFIPRIPIHIVQLILGCEGGTDEKPYIVEALDRFTEAGPSRWGPGEGGHSRDIHKHWHVLRNQPYAVDTHRVMTFRIQTRDPGLYPFQVSFVTDEIEGKAELAICVEDRPKTRMRCRSHRDCHVRPLVNLSAS